MSEVNDSAERIEEEPFIPPSPEEMARLLPSYEVTQLLALGGMGAVYRGIQRDLERPVAIKVLPPDAVRDNESIDRFRTEAKAMARLTHPHIPAVYDFAVVEGFGVLVMELIEGPNVYALIRKKLLPPPRALQVLAEVCDAVQFAHSRRVIHGDIKPGNIMLDTDGRAKLTDFGLARLMVQGDRNADSWTPMGTPEYAAPELYDKNAAPDHRADIYSLGVVLHEMLTGAPPVGEFDLPGAALGLDPRVDEVIARCMELQPVARYQSAAEVRAELMEIIEGRNVPVPQPAKTTKRRIYHPGLRVPPGVKRRFSQQIPPPSTRQRMVSGPPTVARAQGPPTVAPAGPRRRRVVVMEGGQPRRSSGFSADTQRNLFIFAAIAVIGFAAYLIFTGGSSRPEEGPKEPASVTGSEPPARPESVFSPGRPSSNTPPRPEPRPEPRPDPKPPVNPVEPEPPASKVHARLHELRIAWRDEWNKKVEAPVNSAMTGIATQYKDALTKLENEAMLKGDAASTLAVRGELARFEKEKTGVKAEAVSNYAPLGNFQKALTARLGKVRAEVKYDADQVKEKYLLALRDLERLMDDANDKAGSRIAGAEFTKVAALNNTELRDYFNKSEE